MEIIDWNRYIYPAFTYTLKSRITQKLATVVLITGEAGIGKTHCAIKVLRKIDPDFSVDQVVFRHKDFLNLVVDLPPGKPIVFDEPQYVIGHRKWYKEVAQVIVDTIESFRFTVHPLFIPIINKSLIDKTVRKYLVQYQIVVFDRGYAKVYRVRASQFTDDIQTPLFCELYLGLIDSDKCQNPWCLTCPKFKDCNYLRAQYERKRASIQIKRYKAQLEEIKAKDTRDMTMRELIAYAKSIINKLVNKRGEIDVGKIMEELGIGINKARVLKRRLMEEL